MIMMTRPLNLIMTLTTTTTTTTAKKFWAREGTK